MGLVDQLKRQIKGIRHEMRMQTSAVRERDQWQAMAIKLQRTLQATAACGENTCDFCVKITNDSLEDYEAFNQELEK